jgi:hypothetical protein
MDLLTSAINYPWTRQMHFELKAGRLPVDGSGDEIYLTLKWNIFQGE